MTPAVPERSLQVIASRHFVVTLGAALGDPLSFADDLVLDDAYELSPDASPARLVVAEGPWGLVVAPSSPAGTPGHRVHLDCALTLMARDGRTLEALVLVEADGDAAAEVWLLPLALLEPRTPYRLVGLDRHAATARLAQAATASFARGTRITMASGAQTPVEELRAGDLVLTRDDGPQPLRWVGARTVRAAGAFAPVLIRRGVLHNERDLLLSPDHRVFVYQRHDRLGAGRAPVMVKARHLVGGDGVSVREGGFVDYVQLLFDDHQIVFAEGIAAESLLVDPRTQAALPPGLAPHGPRPHHAYEVEGSLLPDADVAALLRRASGAG